MNSKRVFVSADHGLAVFYLHKQMWSRPLLDAGGLECGGADRGQFQAPDRRALWTPGFDRRGPASGPCTGLCSQYPSPTVSGGWISFGGPAQRGLNLAVVNSYIRQVKAGRIPGGGAAVPGHGGRGSLFAQLSPGLGRPRCATRCAIPAKFTQIFSRNLTSPGFRQDRYLLRGGAAGRSDGCAIISWDSSS